MQWDWRCVHRQFQLHIEENNWAVIYFLMIAHQTNIAFPTLDLHPKNYPNHGLSHTHQALKEILPHMKKMTLQENQLYADAITKRYCNNFEFVDALCQSQSVGPYHLNITIKNKANINATLIGNVAYMSEHAPDIFQQQFLSTYYERLLSLLWAQYRNSWNPRFQWNFSLMLTL